MSPHDAVCPDCGGPKYRYAKFCKPCSAKGDRNPRFGKSHSAEARAKISAAASRPKPNRRGSLHPMWKGDDASVQRGRGRAASMYAEKRCCEKCGATDSERHHVDGNTLNNTSENIAFLCRPHHRQIHPGNGRQPLREYVEMARDRIQADGGFTVDVEIEAVS
jgi:hypothetical protein